MLSGADVRSSCTSISISGVSWSSAVGDVFIAGAGVDVRSSSAAILIPGVVNAKLGI